MQDQLRDGYLEGLALQASCQRLKTAGVASHNHLCTPEVQRILKVLGCYPSSAAVAAVLEVPIQMWQGAVPQLFSMLVADEVSRGRQRRCSVGLKRKLHLCQHLLPNSARGFSMAQFLAPCLGTADNKGF